MDTNSTLLGPGKSFLTALVSDLGKIDVQFQICSVLTLKLPMYNYIDAVQKDEVGKAYFPGSDFSATS